MQDFLLNKLKKKSTNYEYVSQNNNNNKENI
jgi:hypothetical protein